MKKFKITKTEIGVLVAIIVLSIFVVVVSQGLSKDIEGMFEKHKQEQEDTNKSAYAAWVKVTGNPKELTYEEWKALSDKGLLPKEKEGGAD